VVCTYIHPSFTSIPLHRAFSDVYIHTCIHTYIHTYAYREFQQMSRCMSRMFLTGWNPFFAKISEITHTSTPLHTLHRMYVSMYVCSMCLMYVCMYVCMATATDSCPPSWPIHLESLLLYILHLYVCVCMCECI